VRTVRVTRLAIILAASVFLMIAGHVSGAPMQVPAVPHEDWGACPFECCSYGGWVAQKTTPVYARRSTSAPVVFRLAPGDSVRGMTGVVVTQRLGLAVSPLSSDRGSQHATRAARESVAVLHDEGEGYWSVWRKGQAFSEVVLDTSEVDPRSTDLRMVRYPQYTWWAHVRDMKGRTGWVREPYCFWHVDSCE
jgi:hypothetical protein